MAASEERLTAEGGAPETARRRRAAPGRPAADRDLDGRGNDARAEAGQDDRDGEISREDLAAFETFMESLDQSVLPDLPKIPGYHVCWLTTNNLRDSLAWRERVGYTPVRIGELKNWSTTNLKTAPGDDGLVRINEMVAYKIPTRLYQRYMLELHHNRPLAEEEKLKAKVDSASQQLEQVGSRVTEVGDGTAEIVQRTRQRPVFPA
jgi:hypothetical protein